jgi:CheY-like chemotaxis protein
MSSQLILIADGDPARGQRVAHALEAGGHTSRIAEHGAAALEIALSEQPSVVVAQADLPLVDASKLCEILRANPRTRSARFVFLGGDPHSGALGGVGDLQVGHAAETDEVLDAVTALLERQERMQVLDERASTELEFAGTTGELRTAELLQMLHLRAATGRVMWTLEGDDVAFAEGIVVLDHGEIVSARVGPVSGEKALFRILDWQSGSFRFEPGTVREKPEIRTPTRSLLAEGLRQLDEWNRLSPALPPLESPVKLKIDRAELPSIVHPLTQEVLGLLDEHDRVGDIVDHCRHSDYQVLRTLHTLEERGIIEFGRAQIAPFQESAHALFNEAQCRRLRSFAQVGLVREAAPPDLKLLVVSAGAGSCDRFGELLAKVPGTELAPRFERGQVEAGHLESIARLDIDGELGIELIHLPIDGDYQPLWSFATHRALGTIFLLDSRVGPCTERLAPIGDVVAAQPGARSFHVVILGSGERFSPDELRDNLSLIDEASLFLLPIEEDKDPGSLLRSLFGRIVP